MTPANRADRAVRRQHAEARAVLYGAGREVERAAARPVDAPVSIVKTLKGISAKTLFETHPILRTMFRHGHLWSPSYYVGTVGHVSEETVARYVRDQKLRTRGRPAGRPSSPQ
ncbi:MAG: IS200/IS605 family transposase [Candidatus Rokubacteria bacterium]|nr:IS200/IS605 family transposase [Candidatus Rokubacteria bacterium]